MTVTSYRYWDLEAPETAARLRLYASTIEAYAATASDVIQHIPIVYREMFSSGMSDTGIYRALRLPILVCEVTYERFGSDGIMVLADIPNAKERFSPLPVVLANSSHVTRGSAQFAVMLRHESVHVEQVIRGDYLRFVTDDERRAIAADPSGRLLCEELLMGKREAIVGFASRRLVQDIYNEGEAYEREISEFGHRVDFWEAWTDLFLRAADYFARYSIWHEHDSIGSWVRTFADEIRAAMLASSFFKTRYVQGHHISFWETLRGGAFAGGVISFRCAARVYKDIALSVPHEFIPPAAQ